MSQESLTPESVERASGMPTFGLGTWENEDPEACAESSCVCDQPEDHSSLSWFVSSASSSK